MVKAMKQTQIKALAVALSMAMLLSKNFEKNGNLKLFCQKPNSVIYNLLTFILKDFNLNTIQGYLNS